MEGWAWEQQARILEVGSSLWLCSGKEMELCQITSSVNIEDGLYKSEKTQVS